MGAVQTPGAAQQRCGRCGAMSSAVVRVACGGGAYAGGRERASRVPVVACERALWVVRVPLHGRQWRRYRVLRRRLCNTANQPASASVALLLAPGRAPARTTGAQMALTCAARVGCCAAVVNDASARAIKRMPVHATSAATVQCAIESWLRDVDHIRGRSRALLMFLHVIPCQQAHAAAGLALRSQQERNKSACWQHPRIPNHPKQNTSSRDLARPLRVQVRSENARLIQHPRGIKNQMSASATK